jgi:hypothetical protein
MFALTGAGSWHLCAMLEELEKKRPVRRRRPRACATSGPGPSNPRPHQKAMLPTR